MSTPLLPDGLWNLVQPMLPSAPPRPKGGRPRVPDRACLTGILFVLRSGIPWEMLPQELGCGSGMTCWRRLRDWQELAIWDLVHFILLDWLARCGRIEMAGRVENRYLSKPVNKCFCPSRDRSQGIHKDFTGLFQRRPQRAVSVVWRAQPDICSRHKRLRLSSNGKQCESI
jgi:transposase